MGLAPLGDGRDFRARAGERRSDSRDAEAVTGIPGAPASGNDLRRRGVRHLGDSPTPEAVNTRGVSRRACQTQQAHRTGTDTEPVKTAPDEHTEPGKNRRGRRPARRTHRPPGTAPDPASIPRPAKTPAPAGMLSSVRHRSWQRHQVRRRRQPRCGQSFHSPSCRACAAWMRMSACMSSSGATRLRRDSPQRSQRYTRMKPLLPR